MEDKNRILELMESISAQMQELLTIVEGSESPKEVNKQKSIPECITGLYRNTENRLIPVPTIYGTLALWHPEDIQDAIDTMEAVAHDDLCLSWDGATFDGDNILLGFGDEGSNGCEWIAMWMQDFELPNTPWAERLIIPIVTEALERLHAPVCCSPESAVACVKVMHQLRLIDFQAPRMAWKITHPGMMCKGQQYSLGSPYLYNGEIALHLAGFHFADDANALLDWYKPFDEENEVYIVQIGKNNIIEDGVGVTDSILFNKRIGWDEL